MAAAPLESAVVVKAVMLGNSAVGKTSLMSRSQGMIADPPPPPTIGVEFAVHVIHDPVHCIIQLHDTSGQERFRSVAASYFRNAQIFVLVFDLSRRITWDALWTTWWPEVLKNTPLEQFQRRAAMAIVIGNKFDLVEPGRQPPRFSPPSSSALVHPLADPETSDAYLENNTGSTTDNENDAEHAIEESSCDQFVGTQRLDRCVPVRDVLLQCRRQGIGCYFETSTYAKSCDFLEILICAVRGLNRKELRARAKSLSLSRPAAAAGGPDTSAVPWKYRTRGCCG
jgi:signal recognition particle receptor subunit beta